VRTNVYKNKKIEPKHRETKTSVSF